MEGLVSLWRVDMPLHDSSPLHDFSLSFVIILYRGLESGWLQVVSEWNQKIASI